MANLADLRVGLLLNDATFRAHITNAMNHAGRETKRFSDKAKRDAKGVEDSFNGISKSVTNVAGKLALLAGGGLSIGSILSVSRQYGQALADLSAITGASAEQMKRYDEAALKMGRTTEFGATKVADAMKLLASAKPALLKTAGALEEVTAKSITLAQASGIDLAEAAKSLSLSLNQYGASAISAERYINVLAAGAKYGASEINETSQAIKTSGTVAAQAGISFEELNAAVQVLADKGIKGAEAGRMMRNVILTLERSADKSLRPSIVGLAAALDNLDKKNYTTTASVKLFGRANVSAAVNLRENTDKLKELTIALTGTDTAYDQASIRANNLNGDLELLGTAFEGVALAVGHSADGPMRSGIQGVTAAVNGLTDNFSTLANIVTYAVLPVMASRMAAGLQGQIKSWAALESATRSAARTQAETSRKAIADIDQELKSINKKGRRLTRQRQMTIEAGTELNGFKATRLSLERQETESLKQREIHTNKLAAANSRLSISQRALSASASMMRSAYSALGGPVGVIMLAGSALYYFHNKAQEARKSATDLKNAVLETTDALMQLSITQLEVKLLDFRQAFQEQKAQVSEISAELERVQMHRKVTDGFWGAGGTNKGRDEKIIRLSADLENSTKRLHDVDGANLKNTEDTIARLRAGEKPKPKKDQDDLPKEEPVASTGTNELPKTKGNGKKELNQYKQLRHQIESEHATSLEKISLSESETLEKLKELHKSGGMSQSEMNRLSLISAENYQLQRVVLAEKHSPTAAMLRQEHEASKEMKSLLDARLLTEEEYQRTRLQLTQTSQRDRLSQQAKDIALPNISLAGDVDPVVQLRNQLEEQKALYQAYYNDGVISKERYEALVKQASEKSKEAQIQAGKELYAAQNDWQKMQINLIDTVEQKTAGSLAGMLTGTKSFSEGLRDLSASLAESIIQDLIKIMIQGQITNAITGLFGGFGGAAASAGGGSVPVTANAKGGTYNSPGLSQYSNQVVSSPTVFAFAKGGAPNVGLMGEAGDEAIMPLKRGPDGNLGVRTYGSNTGGGSEISVNIGDIHFENKGNNNSDGAGNAAGIKQQLKTAVIDTIGDQVQRPGTPLWNAINGRR